MGLLDKVFRGGARRPEHDFRKERRKVVAGGRAAHRVEVDGELYDLIDISASGFCMAVDEVVAPDKATFRFFKDGTETRKVFAMRCWGSRERVGYRIATDIPMASMTDGLSNEAIAERVRTRAVRLEAEARRAEAQEQAIEDGRAAFADARKRLGCSDDSNE